MGQTPSVFDIRVGDLIVILSQHGVNCKGARRLRSARPLVANFRLTRPKKPADCQGHLQTHLQTLDRWYEWTQDDTIADICAAKSGSKYSQVHFLRDLVFAV